MNMIQSTVRVCIYQIANKRTGKSYVGSTDKSPLSRWREHITQLTNGNHNPLFQQDWTGSLVDWEFRVLEDNIPKDQRLLREAEWMYRLQSAYNDQKLADTNRIYTVLRLRNEGKTLRAIASEVQMSLGWVMKTTQRWKLAS